MYLIEKKYEIESKLKNEISRVEVLRNAAKRSSELSNDVCNVLGVCEQRLQQLEDAVLPLYGDTAKLQQIHKNMERSMSALDDVISFYMISRDLADLICAGPDTSTVDNLKPYLDALEQLSKAQNYFNTNNPHSVELENINTLYNNGIGKLESAFEDILSRHSRPIQPTTLMEMVTLEEDSSVDSVSVSGSGSCDTGGIGSTNGAWDVLRTAATWLRDIGRPPAPALLNARAPIARATLNAYRDYLKTRSIGHSPLMRAKNALNRSDSSAKKSNRIQKALEKKANKMLMKASQTFEQSTGLAIGPRRLNDSVNEEEVRGGEWLEAEQTAALCAAGARLARHEQRILLGLVPLDTLPKLLHDILNDVYNIVGADLERVSSRARRAAQRCGGESGASICLVTASIQKSYNDVTKTLLYQHHTQLLKTAQTAVVRTFEDWIEGLRTDTSTAPVDGTVHQLTTAALQHLQHLQQYIHVAGQALISEPAYSRALSLLTSVHDQNAALLAIYMRKVLAQLNLVLRSKSENSPDALRAIFRLNNIHYLLQGLLRSNLIELLSLVEPESELSYREMIQEHRAAYMQSWNRLLSHTVLDEPLPPRLRDKDRQMLKDKFSSFNRELDECIRQQRSWSIPDAELCESLKRDNKERVLPPYTAFYNKYAHLPFTNKRDKYVKYEPTQVSAQLDRFFDIAA